MVVELLITLRVLASSEEAAEKEVTEAIKKALDPVLITFDEVNEAESEDEEEDSDDEEESEESEEEKEKGAL